MRVETHKTLQLLNELNEETEIRRVVTCTENPEYVYSNLMLIIVIYLVHSFLKKNSIYILINVTHNLFCFPL